jgi:hypothetical protein
MKVLLLSCPNIAIALEIKTPLLQRKSARRRVVRRKKVQSVIKNVSRWSSMRTSRSILLALNKGN